MKYKMLILALLLSAPFVQQAQELTSLYPARVYTQSEPTVLILTIIGKNMWPDYMTITMTTQLMHVHFKKNGRDEIIRGRGIASDRHVVEYISGDWLKTPGPIEVYITIDGMGGIPSSRSNSLYLQVDAAPTGAPVVKSISNSSFKTGEAKEKYYIRIYGLNFGEEKSTYASIGGRDAPAGWQHLVDGVMDVWVPAEVYTTPGDYPVVVTTKNGSSNAVMLKIEAPVATVKTVSNMKTINMVQKPVQTVNPNVVTVQTVKPGLTMNDAITADKKMRAGVQVIKGITVVMAGLVPDGATSSLLENFIKAQENIFTVDNQLKISDGNKLVQVSLRSTGVEKVLVEQLKKKIEDKATSLGLQVNVNL